MSRSHRGFGLAGLFAAGLVAAVAAPAAAQKDDTKEDVRFVTVDNVEIIGTYYKGTKGKNSPCVLMLHALFSDRNKTNWDKLARQIQKQFGYAVLTFDFRGHGQSTNVTPSFWQHVFNTQNIKGAKASKQTIDVKEFSANYFPAFVNDVVAARLFLDQKNDASECNSGNIVVVGAQDGASIGLLWIASEWGRNPTPQNPLFPLAPPMGGGKVAGGDVKAAVWLSFANPSSKLNRQTPSYSKWRVAVPEIRDKVPQLFLYGADDKVGAQHAESVYKTALLADKDTAKLPKLRETYMKPIKGTKLAGEQLLTSPEAVDLVTKYIERTSDKQTVIWAEKDTRTQRLFPVPLDKFGYQFYLKPAGVR
jgi:hypothetical protein